MSKTIARRAKSEVVSHQEFGRRFRIALKDRGLTAYRAAKLMGVAKGSVCNGTPMYDHLIYHYHRGQRKPGFDQLLQLVQVLGINPRILAPELWEHHNER